MPPAAIAIGGAAIVGGIAGSMQDHSSYSNTSGTTVDPETGLEKQGQGYLTDGTSQFANMVGAGPGQSDVQAGTDSQRDFASLLQQMSQAGGTNPTAQDFSTGQTLAQSVFNPQRIGLQQSFLQQTAQANNQAALMGRSGNDPILAAKLAEMQGQQTAQLDASQGAFASQYAMQQPFQRLDFAQQRTGILSGLASQAMANRQTLAAMGSGIMNNQQNWRLATAQHYGNVDQTSGGGFKGALSGALGGAGTGAAMASGFGAFGGGTGAAAPGAFTANNMVPYTAQSMSSAQYMSGLNPYGMAGGGLGQASATPFSGSYSMGSQFGQPRSFGFGG